ncbi:copper homeostasis membrane protein CopD [Cupriavidus sp. UYPR2.512]|uniref:copper homeostasis membrane protein CopD n=1 Tax=Cupriavidus sp. UYPR2.512 TaxID=1080187 RepID=UPI000374D8E3|nr:copper homeostasis membrane protein CopD [Cupriavidus sp. UYPR2.512]UIF91333.1 copper homeostasis membrane protein CopD [Cupriavidus necator]
MPQPDWVAAGLRLALYVDLALLFGLPLFCIYALHRGERASRFAMRCQALVLGCAVAGIVLSLGALVVMARAMTGVSDYAALQGHVFAMIVTGTDFGVAWSVRLVALLLCVLACISWRSWRRRPGAHFAALAALAGSGGMALATLAWGGHGAMHEGAMRYVHLSADVAHLLAAGAWVGALAAFVLLSLARPASDQAAVALLSRTSNGFARVGTIIVATLLLTGVLNYWFIVGPVLPDLTPMSYGGLLAAKLALFVAMLGLAAANRFRLSPRLALAVQAGEYRVATLALRRSLLLEACAAALVMALVAMLGMLSPAPM